MFFSRPDGKLAKDVPDYRRMMQYLYTNRLDGQVFYDMELDLEKALNLVDKLNGEWDEKVTVFHLLVTAVTRVFGLYPRLNRFVEGRRVYQRENIELTFSIKKQFKDEAPITVAKERFEPGDTLKDVVSHFHRITSVARDDTPKYVDKELAVLLKLPRFALNLLMKLQRLLDYYNLLPKAFIDSDVYYGSCFLTNLGSIGIDSVFHHLSDYGTQSFFINLGVIRTLPRYIEGELKPRRIASLKVAFDERIEDGFYCAHAVSEIKKYMEAPELLLQPPVKG